ncbi:dienelactone hydrolase family protein [Nocardiopsis sp. HNM0947]|uniref:Dienelactone hydrolase family protein n=1 Tax=Nocardiopsis coralli TaxID=2772213 RepID=A0ABR9NZU8_9ACTN|nr:alpha/beta fold hydrolase [Nocardiopsis coralli]MBE2997111.1 dienelactone hydrolase family protein [Nocardiopsis coralli]
MDEYEVTLPLPGARLPGRLAVPRGADGVVVFAHGSGSSRHSSRNRAVAAELEDAGFATLLFDLLTAEEDQDRAQRFDIGLLTERLSGAVQWTAEQDTVAGLGVGLFGASTGAAAALRTAADLPDRVAAVVSRGGRPDLAGAGALERVRAPVLLVVGGADTAVLGLNEDAAARLGGEHRVHVVPGATHLFEEPGALEQVAAAALDRFTATLRPR